MSFQKLLYDDYGKIVLANLYHTISEKLLPVDVCHTAVRRIFDELDGMVSPVTETKIVSAFRKALFSRATRFQVQAKEAPRLRSEITAVVGFDLVREMLEKMCQRDRRLRHRVDVIVAPDASDAAVAKAADLINSQASRLPDITLSTWGTIFWGAPTAEADAVVTALPSLPIGVGSADHARRLRDALGLIHLNPASDDPGRHLFAFRAHMPLAEIKRVGGLAMRTARPSTLDGWDNRRFSQPVFLRPTPRGYGHTIDLAASSFGPGLSEVVSTPIPIKYFACRYIGPLDGADFGSDASYLVTLLGGGDLAAMATDLDNVAATVATA